MSKEALDSLPTQDGGTGDSAQEPLDDLGKEGRREAAGLASIPPPGTSHRPESGIIVTVPAIALSPATEPDKSMDASLSASRNREVLPGASPNVIEPISLWTWRLHRMRADPAPASGQSQNLRSTSFGRRYRKKPPSMSAETRCMRMVALH